MVFAKSVAATWFNKLLRESYPERQKALLGIIDGGMGNEESSNKRCYFTDSDEGLTLDTSAFESLYGGQFTLSTQLIKQTYLVILPTDAAPQFLWKLTPLYMTACPKEEIALDFEREQRWM